MKNEVVKQIEDFVYEKPRSIQEIASHIKKNWRTADRYIDDIQKNFGTLSVRVFREGTRGALKIVYWSSGDKISKTVFQEKLEHDILKSRTKDDFSAFDIFQHIKDEKKSVWIKQGKDEISLGRLEGFVKLLEKAEKQILFLSGNLSFINYKDKDLDIFKTIENLIKRNISIKVLCRVDIVGKENVEKLLSLNYKYGKELIEVHHREQPIRATIIDNKILNLKEIKESTGKENELNKKTFLIYEIKDKEWVEWISKIFWKMFSSSIDSKKRLSEIDKINLK